MEYFASVPALLIILVSVGAYLHYSIGLNKTELAITLIGGIALFAYSLV